MMMESRSLPEKLLDTEESLLRRNNFNLAGIMKGNPNSKNEKHADDGEMDRSLPSESTKMNEEVAPTRMLSTHTSPAPADKPQNSSIPGSTMEDEQFVVEKIVNSGVDRITGELLYEVVWQGYEERTWEPLESFCCAPSKEILLKYQEANKKNMDVIAEVLSSNTTDVKKETHRRKRRNKRHAKANKLQRGSAKVNEEAAPLRTHANRITSPAQVDKDHVQNSSILDSSMEDEQFVVEKIVNACLDSATGEFLFEVVWQGYEERTWEPVDSFCCDESKELLLNYLEYNMEKMETLAKKREVRRIGTRTLKQGQVLVEKILDVKIKEKPIHKSYLVKWSDNSESTWVSWQDIYASDNGFTMVRKFNKTKKAEKATAPENSVDTGKRKGRPPKCNTPETDITCATSSTRKRKSGAQESVPDENSTKRVRKQPSGLATLSEHPYSLREQHADHVHFEGFREHEHGSLESFEELQARFYKALKERSEAVDEKVISVELELDGRENVPNPIFRVDPINHVITDYEVVAGGTPLHAAVLVGHTALVQLLLQLGCPVDCPHEYSRHTALELAYKFKKNDIIDRLMKSGASSTSLYQRCLKEIVIAKGNEKVPSLADELVVNNTMHFKAHLEKVLRPRQFQDLTVVSTFTKSLNDGPIQEFKFNICSDDLRGTECFLAVFAFGKGSINLLSIEVNDVLVGRTEKGYKVQRLLENNQVVLVFDDEKKGDRWIGLQVYSHRAL